MIRSEDMGDLSEPGFEHVATSQSFFVEEQRWSIFGTGSNLNSTVPLMYSEDEILGCHGAGHNICHRPLA